MKKKYYIFELDSMGYLLNILSIVILIGMSVLTVNIWPDFFNRYFELNFFLIITSCLLYFVLHEILHSIGYILHGASFKNIVYGIKLEKGVFYCLCKQNVSRKCILIATMYPLLFIGVITYIIGIIFNLSLLVILSILNLTGCIADICTFLFIKRLDKDIEFSEMDNPLYFAIYSSKDISSVKRKCIKYVKCSDSIERKDLKKITISKPSYIILILLILISSLSLIV